MSDPTPDIAANLARIRARIAEAEARANRQPGSVTLVAVSKTHPAAMVEAALGAGQRVFGENRVQEAAEKFPALRPAWPDVELHIIGALQTNKARDAVRVAAVPAILGGAGLLRGGLGGEGREGWARGHGRAPPAGS